MIANLYKIIDETPINKTSLMKLVPVLKELDELEFYHPAHLYGVLDHSIKAAETLDDIFLRLVLIFHDVGKLVTATKVINKNKRSQDVTKFPNHQQESVRIVSELFKNELDTKPLEILLKLIEYHDTPLITGNNEEVMDKLIEVYGMDFVGKLLKVQKADMITHEKTYYERFVKVRLNKVTKIYEKRLKLAKEKMIL